MNRALFSVHCYLSWGFVSPYIMAIIHVTAALRFHFKDNFSEEPLLNPNGLRLVGGLVICTAIELLSMWNLTRIEVRLCNMLSPEAPPLSLGAYNWSLVFVAMVVDNFLYPISAIRSHFSQSINWSGIRYHLRNGKIHKVVKEALLKTVEKGAGEKCCEEMKGALSEAAYDQLSAAIQAEMAKEAAAAQAEETQP